MTRTTDLNRQDVTDAYRTGMSMSEIARTHGLDRDDVRRIVTETTNVLQFPDLTSQDRPAAGRVTSAELQARAGITFRQIDYWTRTGLIRSLPREQCESGYPREYATDQVALACLLARLLAGGISLRKAAAHAAELLTTGTTTIAGFPVHLPDTD